MVIFLLKMTENGQFSFSKGLKNVVFPPKTSETSLQLNFEKIAVFEINPWLFIFC